MIQQDMPPAAACRLELGMADDKRELMIYIHIPYCIRKCLYCDFLSFGKGSSQWESIDKYINALCHEITFYKEYSKDRIVTSAFIGGGTPSVLTNSQADKLFAAIRSGFMLSKDCEFTIECNPGTLTADKLGLYRDNGVNRISLGLQSADNAELKVLGRIHTFEDFARSFDAAREAGFKNVNVDLMSAIPGQTLKSWEDTLIKTLSFKPEHISAYSLIIEEGTPFYDMYFETGRDCETVRNLEAGMSSERSKGCETTGNLVAGKSSEIGKAKVLKLPDEETEREIYHFTKSFLKENGFERYEISNYSLPGYECRHNSGYWQGKDYIGLGLGAASLFNGRRYANVRSFETYLTAADKAMQALPWTDSETIQLLSQKDRMEEFMFLGLRMCKGISMAEFEKRFHKNINDIYGDVICKLKKDKLIEQHDDFVRLTDYGVDLSNYVLSEFLL